MSADRVDDQEYIPPKEDYNKNTVTPDASGMDVRSERTESQFGSSPHDRFIKFDPLKGRVIDHDAITEAGLLGDELKAVQDRLLKLALQDFTRTIAHGTLWNTDAIKKWGPDRPKPLTPEEIARALGLDPERPDFDSLFTKLEMTRLDRPDRLSPNFLAERYREKTGIIADEIEKIPRDVLLAITEFMQDGTLKTADKRSSATTEPPSSNSEPLKPDLL